MSKLLLLIWGCLLLSLPAAAQSFDDEPVDEGELPRVAAVEVAFIGSQNVSEEAVRARIQLRAGQPFSQTLVDRSVRTLYETGLFDFIEAEVEPEASGVRIIFRVQSKYRVQEVRYVGNEAYSDSRLRSKTELRAGLTLDERVVRADRDAILEYYREKGYTRATVDYEIERNEETGLGTVSYIINEGVKLRIDKVEFVGNEAISSGDLRGVMETSRWGWFSWLLGTGRFDEKQFQEDLDALRVFYKDAGYLDVNISEANVRLDYPTEDELVITITVDEGRQYRLGEVTIEGNSVFDNELVRRTLRMEPGDVFSPTAVDEDVEGVRDLYGAVGYLETIVRAEREPNVETGDIDLTYRIEEGERFFVESVEIEGNTKTRSVVILRELALSPGRVFNMVWMKNSEARLRNTRFFEEVTLRPETTNIPGRKDLKVSVKEARTGQFQFGAGFSTLENAVFFFEFQQSNFDLFNHRSFFQGDGQKFRVYGAIGSSSNEVLISFEEPWLFDQRLAFGVELFRRENRFNSSLYDEVRTGLELYLRKRLFELVDGQVAYRLESVDLQDVGSSAPRTIREESEFSPRIISKATLTLVRDTRDDLIFTTRGSRFQVSTSFAGIGGDTEYVQIETRNAVYIPTFDFMEQVLSVLVRAGTFWEYSGEQTPFFDRYYLGGPNTLRGFDFRDVSPLSRNQTILDGGTEPGDERGVIPFGSVDDGALSSFYESIGGNSYGFTSVEYTFKIIDVLRVAFFYDWGFVNPDDFDFNPRHFHDNWGIGIRLLVLGNPLRLDYGIPITSRKIYNSSGDVVTDTDRGGQFNFSFGTRF